ncbi:MAG: TfoX/Sxy family protein [Pseudomonadota bacterium]
MERRSALDAAIAQALELFDDLGPVRSRKMFGGAGLFLDGRIFGLVAFERIYLKADGALAEALAAEGAEQFAYEARGRTMRMGYWSLPEAALDDRDLAASWARRALAAQG